MLIKKKVETREEVADKIYKSLEEADIARGHKKRYYDVISKMDPKQMAIFICMSQDYEGWQDNIDHIKEVYDYLVSPIEKPLQEYKDTYTAFAEEYLGEE